MQQAGDYQNFGDPSESVLPRGPREGAWAGKQAPDDEDDDIGDDAYVYGAADASTVRQSCFISTPDRGQDRAPGNERERERERDEMARTLPGLSLSMIGDIEEEEICNIAEGTVDEVSFQSYEEEKAEDE